MLVVEMSHKLHRIMLVVLVYRTVHTLKIASAITKTKTNVPTPNRISISQKPLSMFILFSDHKHRTPLRKRFQLLSVIKSNI